MTDKKKNVNKEDINDFAPAKGIVKLEDIFFLATLYVDQKRYKEAIELYENACRIFPDNLSLRINLAKVMELKDQHDTTLMQEINEKISQKRKADDLFANHYFGLGLRFLKSENLPKAKEYFLLAIYKNPVFSMAYLRLGEIFYRRKNLTEAQRAFERAMKLNKFDEQVYAFLGEVYLKKGNYGKALEAFVDAAILSGKKITVTPYHSNIKKAFKKIKFDTKETISRYLAVRNKKFNKLMDSLEKQRVIDQKGFS